MSGSQLYEQDLNDVFLNESTIRWTIYVGIVMAIALFIIDRLSPTVGPQEPPVLKPAIPGIGHILGASNHQTRFLRHLRKSKHLPIATLPMMGSKFYVIWDPALVQSTFRNNQISLMPIALEFALKELSLSKEAAHTYKTTDLQGLLTKVLHEYLSTKHMPHINKVALQHISDELNHHLPRDQWVEIPNFYRWLRDIMTATTVRGLFGSVNFLTEEPSLLDAIWTFEGGLSQLTSRPFPHLTAATPWKARERVHHGLSKYYKARLDENEDVSQLIKTRARTMRKYGFSDNEIAEMEIGLVHVSTSNTIPSLFWFAAHVLSREKLVRELREQVGNVVESNDPASECVTLQIKQLENQCPLLVSCWKEALRLCVHAGHFRRVLQDTTVSDGRGSTYLLKKNVNLHMSADMSHGLEEVWGSDPSRFDPDRFLSTADDKTRRQAYHPFGGGRHLCPGRNFAFAEIAALVSALVVGFDVCPLEGEGGSQWKVPAMAHAAFSEAAAKPVDEGRGFGVRIRRREGWEDVRWIFE